MAAQRFADSFLMDVGQMGNEMDGGGFGDASHMLMGDVIHGHEDMEAGGWLGQEADEEGLLVTDEQALTGDASDDLENWCLGGDDKVHMSRGRRLTPPNT